MIVLTPDKTDLSSAEDPNEEELKNKFFEEQTAPQGHHGAKSVRPKGVPVNKGPPNTTPLKNEFIKAGHRRQHEQPILMIATNIGVSS
ncbi:MAG: hypothetical protein HZA95_00950 [Candidatus Vogelbacteria bacterium]|nr:hypothetical protein [Candidatus Vogelbacteria bacterium]